MQERETDKEKRKYRYIYQIVAFIVLVLSASLEARATSPASVLVTRVRFSTDAMTSAREALALTRLVEGEVSRAGLRMASEIDKLQSLEGDRWKPLEQCSDSSCIAEIAGASGMDYVLYSDAQDLGGSCVVSTSMVSAQTTEKLGIETGQTDFACTPGRLSKAVVEAVQKLLDRTGPRLLGKAGPARAPGVHASAIGEQAEEWDLGLAGMEIMEFSSEPADAVVLMDGKLLCQSTPCSKTASAGRHELSMQKERYQSRTESVTVAKGTKVAWKLTPDFGLLSVASTPPGLAVKLDGKEIGKTPLAKVDVSRGGHEVLVSDRCFFDAGKQINVERGEHETVDVALKAREGGIEVTAEDAKGNALEAEVLVDGVKVGITPVRFKVSICAQQVEVRHSEHGAWEDKLAVKEKQVAGVKAVFKGTPTATPTRDDESEWKIDDESEWKIYACLSPMNWRDAWTCCENHGYSLPRLDVLKTCFKNKNCPLPVTSTRVWTRAAPSDWKTNGLRWAVHSYNGREIMVSENELLNVYCYARWY